MARCSVMQFMVAQSGLGGLPSITQEGVSARRMIERIARDESAIKRICARDGYCTARSLGRELDLIQASAWERLTKAIEREFVCVDKVGNEFRYRVKA